MTVEQKALNAIQSRWTGNRQCPCCNGRDWSVGSVGVISSLKGGAITIGSGAPVLPVVCNSCGYTHLFNPKVLGVLN